MNNILKGLKSKDPALMVKSAKSVRKLLQVENPPIDVMISYGVVPILVEFLERFESPVLQFEASWALTNIAGGTSEDTNAIIKSNAIPKLTALLMSPFPDIAEQAVWALTNIAGDSSITRDYVLSYNVVGHLMNLVENPISVTFLRKIVRLCLNLCCYKDPPPLFTRIEPLLPFLVNMLRHSDEKIIVNACWALSYVAEQVNQIQFVVDLGAVPLLVRLLENQLNVNILKPVLRAVSNVVAGNDRQTGTVLDAGVLLRLNTLLQHQEPKIVQEAGLIVSNIAAGNQNQIGRVLTSNVMTTLVHILKNGDFQSQTEATWVFSNMINGGNNEQIIHLIGNFPVLKLFCDHLRLNDVRITKIILFGLERLFEFAEENEFVAMQIERMGVLDRLENLQDHANDETRAQSYKIIRKYFSVRNSEATFAPVEDLNGFDV